MEKREQVRNKVKFVRKTVNLGESKNSEGENGKEISR